MMGRNAGPPSPSRLSPHISYSVYGPQTTTRTGGNSGDGGGDIMSMLDLPSLDLGEGAASTSPTMSQPTGSIGGGVRRTSFDATEGDNNTSGNNGVNNTDTTITYYIQSSHGKTMTMKCSNGDTIYDCKKKFHEKEGIPVHVQKWFVAGNELEDSKFFNTSGGGLMDGYGFGNETTIHLIIQSCSSSNNER